MDELKLAMFDRNYPRLEEIEELYTASFPDEERKPFEMILTGIDQGLMKGVIAEMDSKPAALAFSIIAGDDQPVILDYLAIRPELRGKGIGSLILNRLEKESDLIVEIESTRTKRKEALDRKRFYLKNGLKENDLEISLFGVDMEILSTISTTFEEYFNLQANYLKQMGLPYEPEQCIQKR